jgi:hypothetical protein
MPIVNFQVMFFGISSCTTLSSLTILTETRRFYSVLTIMYSTQNYWVCALFPSSGVFGSRNTGQYKKSKHPVILCAEMTALTLIAPVYWTSPVDRIGYKVKAKVTMWLTVGRSFRLLVSLCVETDLGLMTRCLLLFGSQCLVFVERTLRWVDGSVL